MKQKFLLCKFALFMYAIVLLGFFTGCNGNDGEEKESEVSELIGTWRHDFSTGYELMYLGEDGYGWIEEYDDEDGDGYYDRDYFDYTYDSSSRTLALVFGDDDIDYLEIRSLTKSKFVGYWHWGDYEEGKTETWERVNHDEENNDDDGNNNDDENNKESCDYRNLSYIIDGKTYKMILVDGGTLAPFYIMQTELPANSHLQIGKTSIGVLNSNGDGGVIKAEFRKFLNKLREVTGIAFRLPTSAEWQYAAKGGKKSENYTYSGSNEIDDVAWYKENSENKGHSIVTKKANELGLYDMSGNYGEVCNDEDDDEYCIDGRISGGCWNDKASDCTVSSWKSGSTSASKIPGTSLKELNAFDSKYITVRLVYSVPE